MDLAILQEAEIAKRMNRVDDFIKSYFDAINSEDNSSVSELVKSMTYSATNGGKRFRPVLALLVGELLGAPEERILPFATAIEFIHTYSLIHDDLPCMDNDDYRRGQPTNHKVFGEDFALLAGDALLTEAFFILATHYGEASFLVGTLVKILSEAAGVRGMVGGQAIDLRANEKDFTKENISNLHLKKTGALIRAAAEGACVIAGARSSQVESIKKFGENLGLAFQIADDILDAGDKNQDLKSFIGVLGLEETKRLLNEVSNFALKELQKVSHEAVLLEHLIQYNQSRSV